MERAVANDAMAFGYAGKALEVKGSAVSQNRHARPTGVSEVWVTCCLALAGEAKGVDLLCTSALCSWVVPR